VLKMAIAGVIWYSGMLITKSGFDVALPAQPEEVLTRMHVYLVVVPCIIFATGLFLLLRYKLTRKTMADVRKQLEERRGKLD
jgi:Na+/melibiose symporter-like transporter